MAGPEKIVLLALLLVVACSDGPNAPETKLWTSDDLLGSWTGQLADITVVPVATVPDWDTYRDNPLYRQLYYFTDLDVTVNVLESSFMIILNYRSDSLLFVYSERGAWELTGGSPKLLLMDSTSVVGKLETWYGGILWEKNECCWRADLSLEPGAFTNEGFTTGVLKISNIQCRLSIPDLVLEKQNAL